jgi:hypothetical protein
MYIYHRDPFTVTLLLKNVKVYTFNAPPGELKNFVQLFSYLLKKGAGI